MAASIGSLAYKLTADPTGFEGGISRAMKAVDKFALQVGKGFASIPNALGKIATAPFNVVQGILGPIQSALSGIPVIGGLLAAIPLSGVGFLAFMKQGIAHIQELVLWSRRLHVATEDIGGVFNFFGESIGALDKAMVKFSVQLSMAQGGSAAARRMFEGLGLSWQALAKQAPLDQLRSIMDHLAAIPNPADRARVGTQLFSRAYAELAPALERGSKAMDSVIEKNKLLGGSFSEAQGALVLQAAKAFKDIELAVRGLQQNLAIVAAGPLVTINELLTKFVTKTEGIAGIFTTIETAARKVFRFIGNAIGELIEEIKKLMDDIRGQTPKGMIADAASGKGLLGRIFNPVAYGMAAEAAAQNPAGKGPGLGDRALDAMDDWIGGLMTKAKKWLEGDSGEKNAFNPRFQKQLDIADTLRSPLAAFRAEMENLNGIFLTAQERGETYAGAVQKTKDAFSSALGIKFKSPLDELFDKADQLGKAADDALISATERFAGLGQLGEGLLKDQAEVKLPSFMTLGSQDFAELQAKLEGQGANSVQDRIAAIMEEQKAKMDEQIRIGQEIARAIRDKQQTVIKQAPIND